MIACYAWSNLMILNAMNIKLNYFPDEPMDIFVRMTPGISREILALIKGKEVFENIFYTEVPRITVYNGIKKKLKLGWLGQSFQYEKQYYRMLNNIVGEKQYDTMLVAGFWNDSLYYINYFAQQNQDMKILLYDEGGATYDNPKRNLCTYYCNRAIMPRKDRIKKFLVEKRLERKNLRRVENKIFLYAPDRYKKIDSGLEILQIPLIDENNAEMFTFFEEDLLKLFYDNIVPYIRKSVFFITNGNSKWLPDAEVQTENLLDQIISKINPSSLVIKTHPNNTANRTKFGTKFEKNCYVDRSNILLESVYPNIDMANKVLITLASSSAMFTKTMFGKEPYIILVFRLFHQYHEYGDENSERYANDLIEMYEDKSKIYIPNTMDEFKECVLACWKNTLHYN